MSIDKYQEYRSVLMKVKLGLSLDVVSRDFLSHMISYPNKMTYDVHNNHWYPIYDIETANKAEELVAEKFLLGQE